MPNPTFSYSADSDRRFRNAIQRAVTDIGDLTIPLTQISKDWYKSERAIFQLSGPGQYPPFKGTVATSSLGGKGNALGKRRSINLSGESEYQKRKLKKWGFDYPLLKASGALERSVTDPTDSNAIHAIIGGQQLIIGTLLPYGVYHQSDAPRSKIPLRKFLFIGPEAPTFATSEQVGRVERWIGILNDFVFKVMEKRGLASELPASTGGA